MKRTKIQLKNYIKFLHKKINLYCLRCTNNQPKEILRCQTKDCPFWILRPVNGRGLYILIKREKKINLQVSKAKKESFL